jgi:hypothetical protein
MVQNEIQSMHWHTMQITTLVHITYRLHPPSIGNGPKEVMKDVHYYVFDDNSHDTFFL